MVALGRVDPILSVSDLDNVAPRVSDRRVILDPQVFERVNEPALHVAALLGPDSRIDQPLSSPHGVEEELYWFKAVTVAVIDESPRCSPHVSRLEEAQRSSSVSSKDPLASDGLLAHIGSHLANVERGSSRACSAHDDPAVIHLEVLVR